MIHRLVFLFALLGCIGYLRAQEATSASSQTKAASGIFHVSHCTSVAYPNGNGYVQHVDGTLDGKKIQLESEVISGKLLIGNPQTLPLGDYPLQLVEEKQVEWGITRRYLLTMPNGKQLKYKLVGLSE